MKLWRSMSVLLVLLLAVTLGWGEKVATMPAPTGYVDDYAGVLSDSGKSGLEDLCHEIHEKTKAQVFFVTIKTLEDEPVEKFANELFAKWKIGEKKTDRGVLLLLAVQEHKRWIEVGYGFEGILNDAKVGDIGREMVPELKASNYDGAARTGVGDVAKVIAADAGVTLAGLGSDDAETASNADFPPPPVAGVPAKTIPVWVAAAPFFLFFGVFGFLVWRSVKNIRRGNPGGSVFGGSGSDSDSGSSFGGGSDDSFGGGDGGSSGGGGAGGDW
jgi:uncharacterized protein